jgi:uncharacterized protein (DUF169 family)
MSFQELLGLGVPPVAVAFLREAPPGVPRVASVGPSGCSYWRLAAEGRVFYTESADHYPCPIGAYTHGVSLPAAPAAELEGLIRTMVGLEYLAPDEGAAIPRRAEAFHVAVYGPFPSSAFSADVVLLRLRPRQAMLVVEAARLAGVGPDAGLGVRPTCAILPETMRSGQASVSLGCIGNRVYTGLGDDELYVALPGPTAADVATKLATIVSANRELERFHRGRGLAGQGGPEAP